MQKHYQMDNAERYTVVEYRGRWYVYDKATGQMSSPRATKAEAEKRLDNLLKFGSVAGKQKDRTA